jgi:hypothetical protein
MREAKIVEPSGAQKITWSPKRIKDNFAPKRFLTAYLCSEETGGNMKKDTRRKRHPGDRDTMRREYDVSSAVRGATAAMYAQGTNLVVIDPDVLDVFPNGASVNEALRALAPVLRHKGRAVARRRLSS